MEQPSPESLPPRYQQPYKFSAEELRVLRECNHDAFYQRCVPISSILGFTTYYGVKSGYLNANSKYGAIPKVAASIICGYFIGKFSYQSRCAEKLMQLPNSHIGDVLRKRKQGIIKENSEPGYGHSMSLAPFSSISPSDTYTDLGNSNNYDYDSRPQYDGLDDSQRPSLDNPIFDEEMPPEQKNTTSYEELRKKNRDEYLNRRTGNLSYRDHLEKSPSPVPIKPAVQSDAHKNKYGDIME